MVDGATAEVSPSSEIRPGRSMPVVTRVRRRGPLFRPARNGAVEGGLYGLDLTAGCAFDCPFCYVRGTPRHPGPGRLLFDPRVADLVGPALDAMARPPRRVVLSPSSDPLPPIRAIRAAAIQVLDVLLGRGLEVALMTRGRISKDVIDVLAPASDRVRVAIAVTTLGRSLGRSLEPMAPSGRSRLKGLERLIQAGISVEVRLEPLIFGLTDTRENLRPLFRELSRMGVQDVTAHYLFLQPAILPTLKPALAPLGYTERLTDDYEGGPVFSIGEAGATKHLPIDARREGLARVVALGAEFGLIVRTGHTQNPDLPRLPSSPVAPPTVPSAGSQPDRGQRQSRQPAPSMVG